MVRCEFFTSLEPRGRGIIQPHPQRGPSPFQGEARWGYSFFASNKKPTDRSVGFRIREPPTYFQVNARVTA